MNRNPIRDAAKTARKASRDAQIASGIRPRAVTFKHRKHDANKKACRGRVTE